MQHMQYSLMVCMRLDFWLKMSAESSEATCFHVQQSQASTHTCLIAAPWCSFVYIFSLLALRVSIQPCMLNELLCSFDTLRSFVTE